MAESEFTIQELQNEEWRDVVGYEKYYSVSSLGRVRSDVPRNKWEAGRILKPQVDKCSYLRVKLYKENSNETLRVHKLVCDAFLGERPESMEVNHIRQPKSNNRISNLEYVTHKKNMEHAVENGLINPPRGENHHWNRHPENRMYGDRNPSRLHPNKVPHGENHGKAKLKNSDVFRIFELKESGKTEREISKIIGIGTSQVGRILRGEQRKRKAMGLY